MSKELLEYINKHFDEGNVLLYGEDILHTIESQDYVADVSGYEIQLEDIELSELTPYKMEECELYDEIFEYIKALKESKKYLGVRLAKPNYFYLFTLSNMSYWYLTEDSFEELESMDWLSIHYPDLKYYKFTKIKEKK
jgi:hypothetical protein